MFQQLPERPDLAQLRRQAKELYRAAAANDPAARVRLRVVSERVTLSVAQLAIAREYGFASWKRLKDEAERRRLIDSGDVDGLARLLATDPSLARDRVHSCLTQPGTAVWDYVGVARFHQLLDHDRIGDIARVLLAAGAPVDGDPGDPETPLIMAASYGETGMARALIDAGADLEATGVAVPGGTALAHAVAFGMTAIVDLLVTAGAVVHTIVEAAGAGGLGDFLTPDTPAADRARALRAAAVNERLDVIDQLLAAGTPVDAAIDGSTALHGAAWEGKARSVRHLLARGADPARRDADHDGTPLDWCRHRHAFVGDRWGHAAVERILEPLTPPSISASTSLVSSSSIED